jgi:hypothetical protein
MKTYKLRLGARFYKTLSTYTLSIFGLKLKMLISLRILWYNISVTVVIKIVTHIWSLMLRSELGSAGRVWDLRWALVKTVSIIIYVNNKLSLYTVAVVLQ